MGKNPVAMYREKPSAPDISLGDTNWHVKLLRRMLAYANAGPEKWLDYATVLSDHFDAELLGFVHSFQDANGLNVTDTVGLAFWEALSNAGESAHLEGNEGGETHAANRTHISARIVEVALAAQARKIREHGNNSGATVRLIQAHSGLSEGQPWCVAFAWAVVDLAYFLEQDYPPKIPGPAKRSCTALVNWAGGHGCLIDDISEVLPGDLIVLRQPDGSYFHIGVCVGFPRDDGRVNTVEGNTNDAGSAEGDGIYDKQRKVANCSFVRL